MLISPGDNLEFILHIYFLVNFYIKSSFIVITIYKDKKATFDVYLNQFLDMIHANGIE